MRAHISCVYIIFIIYCVFNNFSNSFAATEREKSERFIRHTSRGGITSSVSSLYSSPLAISFSANEAGIKPIPRLFCTIGKIWFDVETSMSGENSSPYFLNTLL